MNHYRVLARAYRPQNFDDLVGQDVLVRTLTNAIASKRIAHAFVLTGIRGIGKTTTARIIAKALNCLGEDGTRDSATSSPCGVCSNCVQIREDRHVDVLEMDAASRTGVGDVREIIDAIHYKPVAARYKVYIIDEAHMLSTNAFNALLKTLEEPPEHVIFIFATTEIRKIPVTILSRCQRFDLRRLNVDETVQHLRNICAKESVTADDEALELISIAAEGSVRDALSLMDQAIAHTQQGDSAVAIDGVLIRTLIGLSDRSRLYALLEHVFAGECAPALDIAAEQYHSGASMVVMLQELMQAVHAISRLVVTPNYTLDRSFSPHETQMLKGLAQKLSVGALTKAWQLLLKGVDEVKHAADGLTAAEMVLIRFAYAAQLPDPSDVIRRLQAQPDSGNVASQSAPSASSSDGTLLQFPKQRGNVALAAQAQAMTQTQPGSQPLAAATIALVKDSDPQLDINSFDDILALCEREREAILSHHLRTECHVVDCQRGLLRIAKDSPIAQEVIAKVRILLHKHGAPDWRIERVDDKGAPTIRQQAQETKARMLDEAKTHETIAALLETFPDSTIVDIIPA